MRFRITVRDEGLELRGYVTVDSQEELKIAAASLFPLQVIASPAEDDYNPFREQELRELHHFETEQMMEEIMRRTEQEGAIPWQVWARQAGWTPPGGAS